MADWGPFLAVAVVLTLLLLLLARQSQQVIHRQVGREAGDTSPAPVEVGPGAGEETRRVEDQVSEGDQDPTVDEEATAEGAEHSPGNNGETGSTIPLTPAVLGLNVAFTQALVVVVLLAAAWFFSIPASAFGTGEAPIQGGLAGVALGVGLGGVLWLGNECSTLVADAVGATYDERVRELLAPDSAGGWVALFGFVLPLVALAEELLFRAALVGVPAAGYPVSPWLLVVLAAAAFALGHGAQGRVGIAVTGALGLALGAAFVLTESLLVVVVAHYVVNALEFSVHEYLGLDPLG